MSDIAPIASQAAPEAAFMDPSTLLELANNDSLSDSQKAVALGNEFEKVFVRQVMEDAMKPMFNNDKQSSGQDYSKTFVPELAANALVSAQNDQTPLGISHVLQANLKL